MVFQHYALFPHLTVGENVAFGMRYKGVARGDEARRVAEALGLVQLSGFEKRHPRPALGRPAAARRAGAGARARAARSSCSTSRSARSIRSSARRCRSS